MVQIIYLMDKGSVDIIVLNAMLFSIFSALISIFAEMSRFVKSSNRTPSPGDIRGPHQLSIQHTKLKPIHQYTKQCMQHTIDQLLLSNAMFNNINYNSTDSVEIFHTIYTRQRIIYFMDIDDITIVNTFNLHFNNPESKLTKDLKQDFIDVLKLDKDKDNDNNNQNENENQLLDVKIEFIPIYKKGYRPPNIKMSSQGSETSSTSTDYNYDSAIGGGHVQIGMQSVNINRNGNGHGNVDEEGAINMNPNVYGKAAAAVLVAGDKNDDLVGEIMRKESEELYGGGDVEGEHTTATINTKEDENDK